MNKNTLGVIGLAKRAGKIEFGAENAVKAIRNGRAKYVLIAEDVSDNTRKMISDKAKFYSVNYETVDIGMAALGKAIGRKNCAALAFTDDNFVKAYEKSLTAVG